MRVLAIIVLWDLFGLISFDNHDAILSRVVVTETIISYLLFDVVTLAMVKILNQVMLTRYRPWKIFWIDKRKIAFVNHFQMEAFLVFIVLIKNLMRLLWQSG